MHIPIPEGLQLPQDANTKPFKLDGMFVVVGGKLMPLELGGQPVSMPESEEDEGEDEEEGGEHGGGGEGCGCKECEQKKKGNGFMVAIETAMRPKMK